MAFQTGTQIRPELANADYSGFVNAANIRAQAMMNLGEQIGSGIREYQKNKTITATSLAQLEALAASNPDAYGAVKSVGGDLSKSISNIEKGDYKQRDVLAVLGGMQTYVNDQDRQRQVEAQEIEQKIKLAQLKELQGGPGELSARIIGGYEVITQDGEYKASRPVGGAGQQPTGRAVTMEELTDLQGKGFKPEVQLDAEGNMVLTSMGTFAPRTEGAVELTVGQEKMLEETAKDLAPWGTGGKQQAEANLATYDDLIVGLTSGEITTRQFADLTPQALGIDDTLRQIFNPTGQNAVDNVRRVIFQGLKDTLGQQFTQKEAERLVAASYNPALPEEMNIQRLQDARDVLADVIAAKDDLYNHIATGGAIGNYKGVSPAAVLRSGIKATQDKYDADPERGGFQAPSGITIRVKSQRPTK
jgi:hypothetical protein